MTIEQANSILKFLQRADLKGGEVPEFNRCLEALQQAVAETNSARQEKESRSEPVVN